MKINYLSYSPLAIPYKNRIFASVLVLFGFLCIYLGFFPGVMSIDSIAQYTQALQNTYTDWHPPIMAWVWSKLNNITPGPQNLLAMHLLFLFSGLSLFYLSYDRYSPKCALLFLVIPFFPAILVYTGYLWKDVGLAFSWLCAIALVHYLYISGRLNVKTILLPFVIFLYGFLIRHNSLFGAAPIIFYSINLLFPQKKIYKKITYTVLVFATMMVGGNIINSLLIGTNHAHPEAQVMVDDIEHISLAAGKNYFPSSLLINDAVIQRCGQRVTDTYWWCFDRKLIGENFQELRTTWLKTVLENFPIYLKYRVEALLYLLRVTPFSYNPAEFKLSTTGNAMGIRFEPNRITHILQSIIDHAALAGGILFKSFFWLAYSIILLLCTLFLSKSPANRLAQYLLLSGIFYLLGYFPVSTANDFRYCYWTIVAAVLSTCLILVHIAPRKRGGKSYEEISEGV